MKIKEIKKVLGTMKKSIFASILFAVAVAGTLILLCGKPSAPKFQIRIIKKVELEYPYYLGQPFKYKYLMLGDEDKTGICKPQDEPNRFWLYSNVDHTVNQLIDPSEGQLQEGY